ncbi:NADPH:quinone reductase [Actinoplanes sp. NBRC 14428]|nr:NADPH:quinone reductase [Actinoplanes sp. NBRC 14428]
MRAAVVTSYDEPPHYRDVPEPRAGGEHDLVVDVLAAGLHPRVRMQADGSHYTSAREHLPLVPGIDGVGRAPGGDLWYFLGGAPGSMAERAVIDTRRGIALPETADPVAVAATLNCAIASWLALRRRITFARGSTVMVVGATGGTGRMAVRVAHHLGAGRVIAVGRDAARLAAIPGATGTALLGDPAGLTRAGRDVDVVLDFLWGPPAAATMAAVLAGRDPGAGPLTWINLGEMAGAEAAVPAGLLRSSRLRLIGSGQGSLTGAETAAEVPAVAALIADGTFAVPASPVPLRDVERTWTRPADSRSRIVFLPGA